MLAAFSLLIAMAPTPWHGPARVSLEIPTQGNPYDFEANDVRVRFQDPNGNTLDRLAYFDEGQWHAVLTATTPGTYRATFILNGETVEHDPLQVELIRQVPGGYARLHEGRFRLDDGTPWLPLGHNLGWKDGAEIPIQLGLMSDHGLNWSRIWACHWDGKNPFWAEEHLRAPGEDPVPLGELWPTALQQWDTIVSAAEREQIRFQFVLFHHGLFSSAVNPNWPSHPWNAANGGFLTRPHDFFTDPQARTLTKRWLRHAVARWGHSESIFAWELFNEVEWVDAYRDGDPSEVVAWHADMADFLRQIDPVGRMVITSSTLEPAELNAPMDYLSPHFYEADIVGKVLSYDTSGPQPVFIGEFGIQGDAPGNPAQIVRDGVWTSLLAGHPGLAAYWNWGRARQPEVLAEYSLVHSFIEEFGIASRQLRPLPVQAISDLRGELNLLPSGGWRKAERSEFNLPTDAPLVRQLPSYVNSQTGRNQDLNPEPWVFRFVAPEPGVLRLGFDTIARRGAAVEVRVNGQLKLDHAWDEQESDHPADLEAEIPFPAGEVTLELASTGPDWFTLNEFALTGLGPAIQALAAGDGQLLILRLTRKAAGAGAIPFTLAGLPLSEGPYSISWLDLNSGTMFRRTWSPDEPLSLDHPDRILVIQLQSQPEND